MLSVEGVRAAYGDREVLRGVSLDVAPGEVVGLVGPNGCGKSTLLRVVSGVVKKRAGTVLIDGIPIESLNRRQLATLVAVLPQLPVVPGEIAVLDLVVMGRTPHLGFLQQESRVDFEIARNALSLVGVEHLAGRALRELSGGERQLVLLARAIAQQSPVILLDEPTTSLDIGHQIDLFRLVRDLALRERRAVLAALHDLTLAALYCDRVVLLSRGAVLATGRPADVFTGEALAAVYGTPVTILHDPRLAGPVVVPFVR